MSHQDELPLGDQPPQAEKTDAGPDCARATGSAARWAIPPSELKHHKADIQRQAIGLWKNKDNVFAGLPRYERWRLCVRSVAEIWMGLGPQADDFNDGTVIHL